MITLRKLQVPIKTAGGEFGYVIAHNGKELALLTEELDRHLIDILEKKIEDNES